jgi:short subunit fatty acids transporter
VTFILGVLSDVDPGRLVFEGGRSFWALVPFTMQMIRMCCNVEATGDW